MSQSGTEASGFVDEPKGSSRRNETLVTSSLSLLVEMSLLLEAMHLLLAVMHLFYLKGFRLSALGLHFIPENKH